MRNSWKVILCLLHLCPLAAMMKENTGHYAKISDDVSLFYQDFGSGQPLVFIPGWLMSSDVFEAQIAYFSQNYRVIALDPRSQGRSSLTMENNNYTQHGLDLAKFLDYLQLQDVVLIGSGWGCNDLYAYTKLRGTDNLKAAVFIDAPPKATNETEGKWACAKCQDWGSTLIQPLIYNRSSFVKTWVQSLVEKDLSLCELNQLISQSFRTPTYAALEMAIDAVYADYSPESKLLANKKVPILELATEESVKSLKMKPQMGIKLIGSKPLTFWEQPDQFNVVLESFLEELPSK